MSTSTYTNRGFKYWTDADDAAIREMFHEGKSDAAIASALGRTIKAVELRRVRLNLRNVDRPSRPTGPTGPKPLSTGQRSEIQRHLDAGQTVPEIAALMALQERAVQQAIDNHNMVALPPRNVYRAPSVRIVEPEPARMVTHILPEPEPARMLHPDAPISLPVTDPGEEAFRSGELLNRIPESLPERTPHVVDESKWVALADAYDAAKTTTTQNGYWDYPEQAPLATPTDASEAVEPTPDCQAEPSVDSDVPINQSVDSTAACQPSPWVIYEPHRQRTGLAITLRKSGEISFTPQAVKQLGRNVLLMWDQAGQRIGVRPVDASHPHCLKIGPANTVYGRAFLRQCEIEHDEPRTYQAEMVDGVLIVQVGA